MRRPRRAARPGPRRRGGRPGGARPRRGARPLTARRLVGLAGLLAACGGGPAAQPGLLLPESAQAAVVVRHVDGDTLLLRGEGDGPLPAAPTRVRLLQVDTPEVGSPAECFGPEAAARLAELVPVGTAVRVAADVDPLDRFGRTLLLVWDDDGGSVQESLVRDGYASVLHVGRNDAGLRELEAAEAAARAARRGRWGAC